MNSLEASIRNTKSRGEVNALRQDGKVPAIVYGGTEENKKIFFPIRILGNFVGRKRMFAHSQFLAKNSYFQRFLVKKSVKF